MIEIEKFTGSQAHAWLRRVLSDYLDCDPAALHFARTANGKPVIRAPVTVPRLRFNLSHTHSGVLVGLSLHGEVGVDIEKVRPLKDLDQMLRTVLHPSERHHLEHQPAAMERMATFFRFWTAKEAYTKALGTGLSHGLHNLVVVLQGKTTCFLEDHASEGGACQPIRGCSAVLACEELGQHYALAAMQVGASGRFVLHCLPRDAALADPLRPTVVRAGALLH